MIVCIIITYVAVQNISCIITNWSLSKLWKRVSLTFLQCLKLGTALIIAICKVCRHSRRDIHFHIEKCFSLKLRPKTPYNLDKTRKRDYIVIIIIICIIEQLWCLKFRLDRRLWILFKRTHFILKFFLSLFFRWWLSAAKGKDRKFALMVRTYDSIINKILF